MLELVIERAGKELVSFPVSGKELRVGRSAANDISLPEPTISRHQFRIAEIDGKYFLIDTSGRGTIVNGTALEKTELLPGCEIKLGSLTAICRELNETEVVHSTAVGGVTQPLPQKEEAMEMFLAYKNNNRLRRMPLAGKVINIGTNPSNDLVLEDEFVSGFHCRLVNKNGAWYINDLNSTNGTRLNGVMVSEARLEPGALIALGRSELRVELPEQTEANIFEGMLSVDPIMKPVFQTIKQAAPTDEPVLIYGESGTGKELVARAVHRLSRRAQRSLVAINCAAISKELVESELFGHEKGAFTGAQNTREGLFEEADGGTLFLDEIGELPLELQAKLLRAIENREIRRVGSNKNISVDARIVAATHRQLVELVREKRFREDVYFRLCVIEIKLPPLRKRRKDIPLLAEYFLQQATRNISPRKFAKSALDKLLDYSYPGNVRELKHVVTRAAILCPHQEISQDYLQFAPPTLADRVAEARAFYQERTLQQIEEEAIRSALQACNGNQRAAARILGVARSTLTNKMTRYNIDFPDYSADKR